MRNISISLTSNRGSYESGTIVPEELETLIVEVGTKTHLDFCIASEPNEIQRFIETHEAQWIVGFIGYDVGLQMVEHHSGKNPPITAFPPSFLLAVNHDLIKKNIPYSQGNQMDIEPIRLKAMVNREVYIQTVEKFKQHIQLGDIYEVNYCIPFVAENILIDPRLIFQRLNQITPMPFSALIETDEFAIISASPERFIRKKNDQLFIQPMKGTKARVAENEEKDKEILRNDRKERSENVMIVDLTRNDLSKLAKKGTVNVDELYGVYSFPSVIQMISTVSCKIDPEEKFSNILRATFPMGSMTGAPKKRAMQLIDEYECFARGPFSGMLGYIEPNGDFDFSVLIRTIFYDKVKQKLFVAVGSAITCQSNVEKEYEECLIKLQPLLKALNANIS